MRSSSRRVYVAQLAGLAEQLAQQRDRLSFALAFAEKRAVSTSSDASGERVAPSYTPSLNDQPESTHSGPTPYRPESSGDGGDGGSGGGGGSGGSCLLMGVISTAQF